MIAARKQGPPYGTVVFDCDSTLSAIEGIEALAGDRSDEIRALTDRAMAGELPLEAVYARRLETIRPDRAQVTEVGRLYVRHLLPNAAPLVAALRHLRKRVVIVSGGLAEPVRALASAIGVPPGEVHAVEVRHDARGAYAGFDEGSPLARAGGKRDVLARLPAPLAFVGDGATDLEAADLCARFVAFGGVARREPVFAGADATCDAADFAALAPLLLDDDELERLAGHPDHAPLVAAARPYR